MNEVLEKLQEIGFLSTSRQSDSDPTELKIIEGEKQRAVRETLCNPMHLLDVYVSLDPISHGDRSYSS